MKLLIAFAPIIAIRADTPVTHSASEAFLGLMHEESDAKQQATLDTIKEKYGFLRSTLSGWPKTFDPSSDTETCGDKTINLGKIVKKTNRRLVFEGTLSSQKVEVSYWRLCLGDKPEIVDYVLSDIASEVSAAAEVVCLSPVLNWSLDVPKKVPHGRWLDENFERCKNVQFKVTEATGPLIVDFMKTEKVFNMSRFRGVVAFGIKLVEMLKKLNEKGIVHNMVYEDNVAFARLTEEGDSSYGFDGHHEPILKNFHHAVFYPDSDIVWKSADPAYASPWILTDSGDGEIRSGPIDDLYCAVEMIANILSRNTMRTAFKTTLKDDRDSIEAIKSGYNLFDRDPKFDGEEPMLWENIYETHGITDEETVKDLEESFQHLMESLVGAPDTNNPPYDGVIAKLRVITGKLTDDH